ncbi:Protein of unknown function, partial [Gryllus bimaculatus]
MIEYLTCLAEDHLGTSSWLESFDLKFYFEEGICSLPLRFSDCLPARELHLNCLLNYLTSLPVAEFPTPVLKAFWFLYT